MDLIDAAKNNDIRLVQELLDSGEDINFQNRNGWTALIRATAKGYTKIVRLLLEKRADPNIQNRDGTTALMMATLDEEPEIVRLLLEKGADPNIQSRNRFLYDFGDTALIFATLEGETETVRLLLENGANPNIKNYDGDTALGLALRNGYTDIVELLERHIRSTKIQSRFRGRQTRRKARTQKASQQLKASRLPVGFDLSEMIGKRLRRMPYNPEVAKRIREERENERIADYFKTLAQYGGKKKHKKTKKRKKSKKKTKKRNKNIIH